MVSEINKQINQYLIERRESLLPHMSWHDEKQFLSHIRYGQIKQLSFYLQKPLSPPQTLLCSIDLLHHHLYSFVIASALFARAAIEGGVPDDIAFAMEDSYIKAAERCHTENDCFILYKEMLYDFTNTVIKYKKDRLNVSMPVNAALNYIEIHLHENIRLEDIALYTGLSPSYISSLFKKEIGKTIQHYVCKERIEFAKKLLKYSNLSLSEISTYLGFCTQSHFTQKFRQALGITPLQYRKKYQPSL